MWKDSETEIDYLDFSYIVELLDASYFSIAFIVIRS